MFMEYSRRMFSTRYLVPGIQAVYTTVETEASVTQQQRRPMLLCTPDNDALLYFSQNNVGV